MEYAGAVDGMGGDGGDDGGGFAAGWKGTLNGAFVTAARSRRGRESGPVFV